MPILLAAASETTWLMESEGGAGEQVYGFDMASVKMIIAFAFAGSQVMLWTAE
jgi:hypothetical protein